MGFTFAKMGKKLAKTFLPEKICRETSGKRNFPHQQNNMKITWNYNNYPGKHLFNKKKWEIKKQLGNSHEHSAVYLSNQEKSKQGGYKKLTNQELMPIFCF